MAVIVESAKANGTVDAQPPDEGPLVTEAYVIPEKGAKLVLKEITLPPLKATQVPARPIIPTLRIALPTLASSRLTCQAPVVQVELDMTHCGLCHTDIHMRDNDWGVSNYPMVAGHEGIGVVRRVGSSCKYLQVSHMLLLFSGSSGRHSHASSYSIPAAWRHSWNHLDQGLLPELRCMQCGS